MFTQLSLCESMSPHTNTSFFVWEQILTKTHTLHHIATAYVSIQLHNFINGVVLHEQQNSK